MPNTIPLLGELRTYRREWLSRDLIAGLSVAAVQVPTAIAYAQLAGFSPEVGLYSSMLPVLAYAFFSSSRQLVVGPDAATCILVAAILAPLAAGNPGSYAALSAALALMCGALMIAGGVSGLGFIVNFFAHPILIGFLNGIALSIIAGQFGKFLGIAVEARDFLPSLVALAGQLNQVHWPTLATGAATLAGLIVIRWAVPKAPVALIALAAVTAAAYAWGAVAYGIKLVGEVPSGLPSLGLPGLGYSAAQSLALDAIGLVIVSFTSGMLTARSFAARNGYEIDANQEMKALGVANAMSGLSGGFAISGADSRTAVNDSVGGKTQLVSVVAAIATGAVAMFFAAPLGQLPLAALAAVLLFSAWGLLDFGAYRYLRAVDRFEFRLALLTTIGVLTVGVLPGVGIAILLAIINILIRLYHPQDAVLGRVPGLDSYNDVALDPKAETVAGVIIYRFDGPLLFFNADHFKTRVRSLVGGASSPVRAFVMSVESVTQMDLTAVQAVSDIHAELKAKGIRLLIARPKLYMRKYQASGLGERLGLENMFPSVRAAVDAIAPPDASERSDAGPGGSADQSYREFFQRQQENQDGARPAGFRDESQKKPQVRSE
jgi:high affinity sulfate transporter 1